VNADRVDHPTGSTDVVLRMDQGGGFVAPAFLASQAPVFTLFGDGTVILRNPTADPLPAVGDTMPNRPFRTAKLSDEQIQETLKMAIGQGGLDTARLEYGNNMVADAGTTTFAIGAGGLKKTVSVYALGIDTAGRSGPGGVLVPRPATRGLRSGRDDPNRRMGARPLPRHPARRLRG
jgi:hypothetical protein